MCTQILAILLYMFFKIRNIISKNIRSKVTDLEALTAMVRAQ